MASLRSNMLKAALLLATPILSQVLAPDNERAVLECENVTKNKLQWVLNAPFTWNWNDNYPNVEFHVYNIPANRDVLCYSKDYHYSDKKYTGECWIQSEDYEKGWDEPRLFGSFEFAGTNPYDFDKADARTLSITQSWWCLDVYAPQQVPTPWKKYTATATTTLPTMNRTTDRILVGNNGWVMDQWGREGEIQARYSLPITLTPKLAQ